MIVAIAIPSGHMMHTRTAMRLVDLVIGILRGGDLPVVLNFQSAVIPFSRTMLVRQAQAIKADYILFLDSDMTFPETAFAKLKAHDLDIVGATYQRRDGSGPVLPIQNPPLTSLVEADSIPTGCLLIKMAVFEKLPKPWFAVLMSDGVLIEGDQNSIYISEDVFFCRLVRTQGFKTYIDLALSEELGHIGEFVYKLAPIEYAKPEAA